MPRPISKRTSRLDIRDFGALIDGATDDAAAWNAAVKAAELTGGTVVHPGYGISVINDTVLNPEGVDILGEGEAWLKPGPDVFEMFHIGTEDGFTGPIALTADALAGTQNLIGVTGAQVGDIVFVVSDDLIENPGTSGRCLGQTGVVSNIAAGSVEIDSPLYDDYLTAGSARVYIAKTTTGVRIANLRFQSADDPAAKDRAFICWGIRHLEMRDLFFNGPALQPIILRQCADSHLRSITCDQDYGQDAFGYGITLTAGVRNTLSQITGTRNRHLITTLEDATPGFFTHPHGGPIDTLVSDSVAHRNYFSGFDEHLGAMRTRFINCTSIGSEDSGFQIRGRGASIINCTAENSTQHGVRVSDWAVDTTISGGYFAKNNNGIQCNPGNLRTRISNITAVDNIKDGVICNGNDVVIQGSYFTSNDLSGVHDVGVKNLCVTHNTFARDAAGLQTISVLGAGNVAGSGPTLVAQNDIQGHGAGNDGMFNTGAAATVVDNTDGP